MWAERYDRDLIDIFELQDEIVRSVVSTLQTEMIFLEGSLAEKPRALSLATWAMSKKAWQQLYGLSRVSLMQGREIAKSIIQADPDSPEGYKLYSLCTSHYVFMGFSSDPVTHNKVALSSAETGLRFLEQDEHSQWALGIALSFLDTDTTKPKPLLSGR